jgi:homeobox protein SIX4
LAKDEYSIPQNSNNLTSSANNKMTLSNSRTLNFTPEQVDCICDSLQQRGEVKKLENFLHLFETERPKIGLDKASEAVMRGKTFVAFERGRYREMYNIIETREFDPKFHPTLQDMWYRAHYKEAEGVRGRALGKTIKNYFLHALSLCFVVLVLVLVVETLVKILLYSPILYNFTMLLQP